MEKKRLSEAIAGDKLILSHGPERHRFVKVGRVTKCYIIIGETKYHRSNGWAIGSHRDCFPRYIEVVTPELRNEVLRERLIERLKQDLWEGATNAELNAVYKIYKEIKMRANAERI